MKVLKVILTFILGAGIASLWWAYATLNLVFEAEFVILMVAMAMSLILGIGILIWLIEHWNDE